MLTLGDECSIEPEVDLSGHWLDGDVLHLGPMAVGERARVGACSMLCPGASIGARAELAPDRPSSATCPTVSPGPGPRRAGPGGLAALGRRASGEPPEVAVGVCRDGHPDRDVACARGPRGPGGGVGASGRRRVIGGCAHRAAVAPGRRRGGPGRAGRAGLGAGPAPRGRSHERAPPDPRQAWHGRRGRSSGCWTRPAPGCSRSTRARSPRRGCGPSGRASGPMSRPPRCSSSRSSRGSTTAPSSPTTPSSAATSWAADGSASSTSRWASTPSSATPA